LIKKAAAITTEEGVSITSRLSVLKAVLPVFLLAVITGLAYANAWPNTLVLDDKLFADYAHFSDFSALS